MLFPRCTRHRLRLMLPHGHRTTRQYLRESAGTFQIDPITANAIIDSKLSRSQSNGLSSKGDSRKTKTRGTEKQNKERSDGFSNTDMLSSRLRLHNNVRCSRKVGGAVGMRSRFARVLNGRSSSRNVSMKHEGHPGADENAAPPGSVDGVIQPRVGSKPFLEDVLPPSPQGPIATLAHGLERVLLHPGVYRLQDPRSKVYGFTTWLEQIIPVRNFAFERLRSFVPSSRDEDLYTVAKREGRKYAGSTSSLSGLLGQLYFLISGDKLINTANLSKCFRDKLRTFAPAQRGAASVILHYRDGLYLIDNAEGALPGSSRKNILTWMGTLLEKFLTQSPRDFLQLTRSVDNSAVVDKEPRREAYRYAKSDKFTLRSQLDCFDSRLPGTGVFDLKTRAVIAIRHDQLNFEESSGYQIRNDLGLIESFEREYYDLIRSAFLKYSFQARIGNMDGVLVAYHNTERIFGFQYIPLFEMDSRLFGEEASGNAVFEKCMLLLEAVLEEATRELPHQSIRLTAEKRKSEDKLRVFLEPADWDEHHGSRPIIQLDVSVKHYIGESPTEGRSAVERSSLPWTILWSVSKPTLDSDVIRKNIAGAHKRATYPLFLPRGVTSQKMEKFWHELQFNPVSPVEVPFKPELFSSPPRGVRHLRRLARTGRLRLERSIRKQKGKPKIVQGIPDDAQKVAPLLALAHGPGRMQTVGGSNLDVVDNTITANLSTKTKRRGRKQKPVRSSSMRSKKQEKTTGKAMASRVMDSPTVKPITDTRNRRNRTTQVYRVPQANPSALETAATSSQRRN